MLLRVFGTAFAVFLSGLVVSVILLGLVQAIFAPPLPSPQAFRLVFGFQILEMLRSVYVTMDHVKIFESEEELMLSIQLEDWMSQVLYVNLCSVAIACFVG